MFSFTVYQRWARVPADLCVPRSRVPGLFLCVPVLLYRILFRVPVLPLLFHVPPEKRQGHSTLLYRAIDPSFNFSNSLFNSELLNTQDDDSNDSLYSNLDVQCSDFDENQFINNFKILKNISILSLNIQSLPSKFAEFQELIQNLQINKCEPDILCIQETWQIPNLSSVSLDSYNVIECNLCSNHVQGSVVGLYLKKNLKLNILHEKSIFVDRIFESTNLFLLRSGLKKKKKNYSWQHLLT